MADEINVLKVVDTSQSSVLKKIGLSRAFSHIVSDDDLALENSIHQDKTKAETLK